MFQGSYIPAARLHLDMDGTLPMCLAWQWGWQSPRTSGRSTFASQLRRISGMKTFVFKSILVGARANLLWDQDISGFYYGANIQHHVDTDRTPFILEMTQIWSIKSSSCLTAISKLGGSSRTGSSCLISKSIWMCVFSIIIMVYFVCYMLVFRDRKRSLKKTQHKNCHKVRILHVSRLVHAIACSWIYGKITIDSHYDGDFSIKKIIETYGSPNGIDQGDPFLSQAWWLTELPSKAILLAESRMGDLKYLKIKILQDLRV